MSKYTGMAGCASHVVIDNPPNITPAAEHFRAGIESVTYAVYALAIACTAGVIVLAIR